MLTERVLCRELLRIMSDRRRGLPPVKSAVSFVIQDERRALTIDQVSKETLGPVATVLLAAEHDAKLARQDGEIIETYDSQTIRLRWEREPYNQTKFVADAYPYAPAS